MELRKRANRIRRVYEGKKITVQCLKLLHGRSLGCNPASDADCGARGFDLGVAAPFAAVPVPVEGKAGGGLGLALIVGHSHVFNVWLAERDFGVEDALEAVHLALLERRSAVQ